MKGCVRPFGLHPFVPEAPENQWMINAVFVGQAQLDI